MSIRNTGVTITEEHLRVALDRAHGVVKTPLVVVHGVELHSASRDDFGDWLDRLAVAYGLPEPPMNADDEVIHYGMTSQGEFTAWNADPNECPGQDVLGTSPVTCGYLALDAVTAALASTPWEAGTAGTAGSWYVTDCDGVLLANGLTSPQAHLMAASPEMADALRGYLCNGDCTCYNCIPGKDALRKAGCRG